MKLINSGLESLFDFIRASPEGVDVKRSESLTGLSWVVGGHRTAYVSPAIYAAVKAGMNA